MKREKTKLEEKRCNWRDINYHFYLNPQQIARGKKSILLSHDITSAPILLDRKYKIKPCLMLNISTSEVKSITGNVIKLSDGSCLKIITSRVLSIHWMFL